MLGERFDCAVVEDDAEEGPGGSVDELEVAWVRLELKPWEDNPVADDSVFVC